MVVNYSHHNILIFQQNNNTKNDSTFVYYYYQPALFLDLPKLGVINNPFTQKYELHLWVLMWNQAYEEHIRRKIREQAPTTNFVLSILPIESIRVKPGGLAKQYQFVDRWISYTSQPHYVVFRIICQNNETCTETAQRIREAPGAFIWDLRVQYSLEGQTSVGKSIAVRAEHVQQTSLYAAINQKLPQKNPVYLISADANKLSTEIANNIQGVEIEDEDYIAEQNAPTLMALINKALQFVSNNTKDFDNATWNSVFWSDDNTRPDKVTQDANELYSQLDSTSKSKFKQEVASSSTEGFNFKVGATFSGKDSSGSGSVGANSENTQSALSEKEVDKLNKLLKEAKTKSEWQGEKFVPKPIEVKRMNTGNIKVGTQLSTTQLRVKVSTSILTDSIKLVDIEPGEVSNIFTTKPAGKEVFLVKAQNDFTRYNKTEAASVCKTLNAVLASVEQMHDAYAAGGEWCFTGHTSTTNVAAYPGTVCHNYYKTTRNNATVYLLRTVVCDGMAQYRKTFLYKTAGTQGSVTVDAMRFGANCWGLRPARGEKLKYKSDTLTVMPFNKTHYSQFYE
ncbi:uncharacterized protein LOC129597566 [Paramacrobiotus metropolitanus]|uniref:uncharacterized protein LOC129597566 n=1 Tax=Paramacrobiotus metropolitanus TaxID=2943436 RepID=UPI0024462BA8|nr:uncharacterized protein LOC129597566 [Paramacrobiotus metropolitanus]